MKLSTAAKLLKRRAIKLERNISKTHGKPNATILYVQMYTNKNVPLKDTIFISCSVIVPSRM